MAAKKGSTKEEDEVSIMRSSDFTKTYATNVLFEETDIDVRLHLFNEVFTDGGKKALLEDAMVILTKEAMEILKLQIRELEEERRGDGIPPSSWDEDISPARIDLIRMLKKKKGK
jgi:hypothetical protein